MLKNKVKVTIKIHKLLQPGDRVLVGVSGGPDSLCLLHLLIALKREIDIELFIGHLNHGFRQEATSEFDYIRSLAREWKIPFYGARVDIPVYREELGLSAQEAARYVRYRFLLKGAMHFRANKIATGHHRDDQVETVLLNILHGAGLDGLGGMKICRPWKGIDIVRPLMETCKDDIIGYCRKHGIEPVHDASNLKKFYRRNKVRLELLPYLEREYNPQIREALLRLSCLVREDSKYIDKSARFYLKLNSCMKGKEQIFLNTRKIAELDLSIQRRVLRAAWQTINTNASATLNAGHIHSIIQLYQKGYTGKEISLPGKKRAYKVYNGLIISSKTHDYVKTVFEPLNLNIPGITSLPGTEITFEAELKDPRDLSWPPDKKKEAFFDYDKLTMPLYIRYRQSGDKFHPLGMGGKKKKLKDFLIDKKIPRQERDTHPLIISGNEIIWITGIAVAHTYRITDKTRQALVLRRLETV